MRWMVLAGLLGLLLHAPASAEPPVIKKPQSFPEATRAYRKGVFLVGFPGGHGTAWVISKKHRLLATNAHVADLFFLAKKENRPLQAVMNGSGQRYQVTQLYYHPGVRRFPTAEERLSVRQPIYADWPVAPNSPDVAVLELAPGGPDLPVEFALAPPAVLFDLQTQPVAILGFPAHDTLDWPGPDEAVQATFHEGVVSRITDFNLKAVPEERAQFLQYTMATVGGFSGSPIYLATGEVVGLHNSGRAFQGRNIANGIRVDSLWELLAYNHLTDKVRIPVAANRLDLKRWSGPDPARDIYNRINALADEAQHLIFNELRPQSAIDKCNEALRLYDQYARAYLLRGQAYHMWKYRSNANLSFDEKKDLLLKSLKDVTRGIELVKDKHDVLVQINALQNRVELYDALGGLTGKDDFRLQGLEDGEKILGLKDLTRLQRARALSSLGSLLFGLGRNKQALQKYIEALQLNPDEPTFWDARADFYAYTNQASLARADRDMSGWLRKKAIFLKRTGGKEQKVVSKVEEKLTTKDVTYDGGRYYHRWEVELEAGYFYQIDLKSPAFTKWGDYDPLLRLFDPKGQLIREDDDGGGFPHARIFFTPAVAGSYSMIVTSYNPGQTGPYVLSVLRIAEDK